MKYIKAGAEISDCGKYRWALWRFWDELKPVCVWVMLNPSTADAEEDDPTIRKCVGFSQRWGCGGIYVANIFSWRATDPKELKKVNDPIGHQTAWVLKLLSNRNYKYIVTAWGRNGELNGRGQAVQDLLLSAGLKPFSLGTCANGEPKHPLMLAYSTQLESIK